MTRIQEAPGISPEGVITVIWVETLMGLVCVGIRIGFKRLKDGSRRRLSFSDIHETGLVRVMAMTQRSLAWTVKGLDWDDMFIVLAWIALLVMSIMYTIDLPTIWEIMELSSRPERLTNPEGIAQLRDRASAYLRTQFAIIILFWTQLWLVKAAFMAYYKQLFARGFAGWQRLAWWWLTVFCVVTYIANWPLQFASCSPLAHYFSLGLCETPEDIRISNASLYYAAAADICCDVLSKSSSHARAIQLLTVAVMLLPMSLLYRLTTQRSAEKATAAAVFGAALLVVALSVLRLSFTTPGNDQHVDPRWLAIWSSSECAVAVIVAAAPAFAHLFRAMKSSSSGASHSSRRQGRPLVRCNPSEQALDSDDPQSPGRSSENDSSLAHESYDQKFDEALSRCSSAQRAWRRDWYRMGHGCA